MTRVHLYLVRHAIAEDRDSGRWPDDSERPLTPAGAARFECAARGLGTVAADVDVVLSSPYVRAWETAEILEHEAGWPAPGRCSALEASRAPDDALAALAGLSETASAALVGHEPQLSMLASLLLVGSAHAAALELKKGGVVLLDCVASPAAGRAVLRWSASPKLLRGLDRSAGSR
jgi:phosphohistidine phosphatase